MYHLVFNKAWIYKIIGLTSLDYLDVHLTVEVGVKVMISKTENKTQK